jgi:mannose-6-phosphate isomerase-like protein (cupin superfamily)
MGRMRATFVADDAQTASKYSISEWWLESHTQGPGVHAHEDDHVFYVIEGTLSVQIAGEWFDAERGSYVVIPGETPHDFENRGPARCGFITMNVPGGFESKMPSIVESFAHAQSGNVPSA